MRLNFQSTMVLPLQYRIALQLTNVIDGVKIWEKKDKRKNTNLTYFSTSIDIQANSQGFETAQPEWASNEGAYVGKMDCFGGMY